MKYNLRSNLQSIYKIKTGIYLGEKFVSWKCNIHMNSDPNPGR